MKRMDEKGVSPVIGVILMVAITVILAAVIASFVFGMGSSVKKTYNVAVTAQQIGSNVIATINGGPDFNALDYVIVRCPNGTTTTLSGANLYVGASYTCQGDGTGGLDRIVVTGHFKDGSDQVLLDTTV